MIAQRIGGTEDTQEPTAEGRVLTQQSVDLGPVVTGGLMQPDKRFEREIGVRRALGATRGAIFAQYLVESTTIGLAGGVLGLGLALLGLWAVRQQPVDYAGLARLDAPMLLAAPPLANCVTSSRPPLSVVPPV